ncbi:MAG: hypothetical protein SGPRY_005055, partial [Prymnesium sp.]
MQGVVATRNIFFTDQLGSSSSEGYYRTIRVVYMLLDDEYRANVAPTPVQLSVIGLGPTSMDATCGTTRSSARQHTCSVALGLEHFKSEERTASVVLTTGSTSISRSITLAALPVWATDYCSGLVYASCASSDNFLYARAPAGAVPRLSTFVVEVRLRHTGGAGAINFRFQFDPSVVEFVGSSMAGSPYAAMQLSDPPLFFSDTKFATGYDALVSATTFDTTYTPTATPTLVCTLTFRALSAGDALRMSVAQALSVGDSTLIDHNDAFLAFDVLGSSVDLLPEPSIVGILASMPHAVANLQAVSAVPTSVAPDVVSVRSDYSGQSLSSSVTEISCSSASPGLTGCVTTTPELTSGDASVVVTASGFSTLVAVKTYAPASVLVKLSRPSLSKLCAGRYQSSQVSVLADGIDVTEIAAISGYGFEYDSQMRSLRPSVDGVLNVLVAGAPLAQVSVRSTLVVGAALRGAAITRSDFTDASIQAATAELVQSLTQEGDAADIHALLTYSDGTTEPLSPSELLVTSTHPSIKASDNRLSLLAQPQVFCGAIADLALSACPSIHGSVSAFIDVPEVLDASLLMQSPSCLARANGEVAASCIGAPQMATLRLQMTVRFSDGRLEVQNVPESRVMWHDSAECTRVSSTGTAGVYALRVVGSCESTMLTAQVDGKVDSSGVSVCVIKMTGVQIEASNYPGGGPVSGAVEKIPCTDEFHRVQATAQCSTSTGVLSAAPSAVRWLIGDPTSSITGQATAVITLSSSQTQVIAQIGDWDDRLLIERSTSESTFTVEWTLPSTLSLEQGGQVTYPPVVTFSNGVTAPLDGSFSWINAAALISSYHSSNPSAVVVHDSHGTISLHANAHDRVALTLTPCQGDPVHRSVWANLLPAAGDLDLSTSSSTANVGQQLSSPSGARARFYVFMNIPAGKELKQAEVQLMQEKQAGGGFALQAASDGDAHGDDFASFDLTRDTSVVGGVNRIFQPIFNLVTSGTTFISASSRRSLFWFDMESTSGTASATVNISLHIVNIKYSDDSSLTQVAAIAANGSIALTSSSSADQTGRRNLLSRHPRQLRSYSQADFASACSRLAYDIDDNGAVEQVDIEMFTYYLLNRHALDESVICPYLRQWLDPTLDGRSNAKDWIYFWQANANNKLLVTQWSSMCVNQNMNVIAEVKRFASETPPGDTEIYFEVHFERPTSLIMLSGSDATASECAACKANQQFVLRGTSTDSQSSNVWTSAFEVAARFDTGLDAGNSYAVSVYVKTHARSGDGNLLVDTIARLSSFGGTLIDDSLGYSPTSPYTGQGAVLALEDAFPALSPTTCTQ